MGRGRGRGRGKGGRGKPRDEEDGSSSEDEFNQRPDRGQSVTAGMLPPSDSDSDYDSSSEDEQPVGQNPNVGMLPPSSSDEDGSDSDGSSSEEEEDKPRVRVGRPMVAEPRKKKDEEIDPGQLAEDMSRLELIKKKREQQRLERIQAEGWDRFAPMSAENHPPGTAWPPIS